MRIVDHPILGKDQETTFVEITVDGKKVLAKEGEMIAGALLGIGLRQFHRTEKGREPRSYYCGIGQCTDCMMEVDGIPGVRTCITPVRAGMEIRMQDGVGQWRRGPYEED